MEHLRDGLFGAAFLMIVVFCGRECGRGCTVAERKEIRAENERERRAPAIEKLRQTFVERCEMTPDGVIKAYPLDAGAGAEADEHGR